TAVDPFGRDEDGAVLRLSLHSVVGPPVSVASAVVDVGGRAAPPVEPEEQRVGLGGVVVVGEPHVEAPAVGRVVALNREPAAGTVARLRPRAISAFDLGTRSTLLARVRPEVQRRGRAATTARNRSLTPQRAAARPDAAARSGARRAGRARGAGRSRGAG